MTTNLHDKMLAAIDAYFSASDGTEEEQVAENLLLDVRAEIRKQKDVPETNFGNMAEPKIGCVNHDCDKCKAAQEPVALDGQRHLVEILAENWRVWPARKAVEQTSLGDVYCSAKGRDLMFGNHEIAVDQDSAVVTKEMWSTMRQTLAAQPTPVQEPVAWQVHPFDYGIGHQGVYARTDRSEQVEMWKRKGWNVQPLYTTPPAAPVQCEWCNGRGVLAGHAQDGSFDGEDCPHCTPPAAQPAVPPMHASGLVAIRSLLSRDPCIHAKVAIEMIDAMLAAAPQPVPVKTYHDGKPWPVQPAPNMTHASDEWALTNQILRGDV